MVDGHWVAQGTSLLVGLMGVAIYLIRPRTRSSLGLATVLSSYGFGIFLLNTAWSRTFTGQYDTSFHVGGVLAVPVAALLTFAVLFLGATFPSPIRRDRRSAWIVPAAILFIGFLGSVITAPAWLVYFQVNPTGISRIIILAALGGYGVAVSAGLAATALLAHQYHHATSAEERRRAALAAAGLSFPFLVNFVTNFLLPGLPAASLVAGLLVTALVLGSWLRVVVGAADSRPARNAFLAMVGAGLLSLVPVATGYDEQNNTLPGIGRIIAAAVLAYGLLHGHLLGLDVKVRWTVSKSTLAAMFIAVFFVSSEMAQQFFGETLQSTYWGIWAAGALVFAFSPLQRLADRIAARAVPAWSAGSQMPDGPLGIYRRQALAAWADGKLGRKERTMLRALRADLGIDAATADAIEGAVEERGQRRGD